MSQPDLINSGMYEEKPGNTVYTTCLAISFISLCLVSWLLSLEMQSYDNDFKAEVPRKIVVPTVAPPLEPDPSEADAATAEGEPEAAPAATPTATGSDPEGGAMPAATATPAPAATGAPAPAGSAPAPAGSAPADPDAAPKPPGT